ncbi:MAG: YjbH domain-containing protein [Pseudomonadota bacterium]
MPDARIDPDGTLRLGVSNYSPYRSGYAIVSLFPWLETSAAYTRVAGVAGFPDRPEYGYYKDKSFGFKGLLFKETNYLPNIVVGGQDFFGTSIFRSQYIAASKKIGDEIDLTLGYGNKRIDGAFGGIRYKPKILNHWSFIAEYDAYNYAQDLGASDTGVDKRKKSPVVGIGYTWGPFNAQVSRGHNEFGVNAYFKIPLNVQEYVPKFQEPPPYTKVSPRPTLAQWNSEGEHKRRLASALYQQSFRDIRIDYVNGTLQVSLTNNRISTTSRAVGRAARVIVALAPVETREIQITYTVQDLPIVTYDFFDVATLQRYFNGMVPRKTLAERVDIHYASPEESNVNLNGHEDRKEMLAAFDEVADPAGVHYAYEGDVISFRSDDANANSVKIRPAFSAYLNDPSGAFRYSVSAVGSYDRKLGEGLFLQSLARVNLLEDVSKVSNPSNSELPHVRSDVADYFRDSRYKLDKVVVNNFSLLGERVYARASAGLYEMMYGGAGGQVLYIPRGEPWAVDVSVDALRQRDTKGLFGFRDYSTVTALAALHYRLPIGVTATVRAGRFLARDRGARFELKRRFDSGIEFGAWYTITNGNDITSPGTVDKPYHDKGIFLSLPFGPLLTSDTQALAAFSLAPWTRDVGQMVNSPADLYEMVERPLFRDVYYRDGLSQFGDVADDYHLPSLGTSIFERPLWSMAKSDALVTASTFGSANTWKHVGLGLGIIAASTRSDNRVDSFAAKHNGNIVFRNVARVGNAVPLVGAAGAAFLALGGGSDNRLSSTAMASVEAAGVSVLANLGLKYAVGRSRPDAGLGSHDFHAWQRGNTNSSFASTETTAAWAIVTPFAKEYDAPWLYGVAALTNAARVIDRKHWVSDTVAGALLGYGIGTLYWQSRRKDWMEGLQLDIGPNSVQVTLPIK